MKNLVHRLAAQALGLEPVLTPRTGSLFEDSPESAWEHSRLEEVVAEVTATPRTPAVAASERAAHRASPGEPQRSPVASEPAGGEVSRPALPIPADKAPAAPGAVDRRGDAVAPRAPDPATAAESPTGPPFEGTRSRPRRAHRPSANGAPRAGTERRVAPAQPDLRVRSAEAAGALATGSPLGGGPSAEVRALRAAVVPDEPKVGAFAEFHQSARLPSAASEMNRSTALPVTTPRSLVSRPSPEEAVVNVTIGRIEVRALQPPPAAPLAPRPRPPFPSLEEYLERTSGSRAR